MEGRTEEAPVDAGCRARLRDGFSRYVGLYVYDRSFGKLSVGYAIQMHDVPEGEYMEPTMVLDTHAAQELIDSLWDCGLRPTEGSGSAGQLASVQYHLEDMRRIVFK